MRLNKRSKRRQVAMTILPALILSFLACAVSRAQSRWIDRSGTASFFSSAPLEDITAQNHHVVSILDVGTGEIVASMLMRSFDFRKALMQEHFNENYVESHKYPKAVFKGTVLNIKAVDLSVPGEYTLNISGEITLHGVTRPLKTSADVVVKGDVIEARSVFPLRVADFKIEVPRLVVNNIAEVVEVTVSFTYKPMQ